METVALLVILSVATVQAQRKTIVFFVQETSPLQTFTSTPLLGIARAHQVNTIILALIGVNLATPTAKSVLGIATINA